MITEIEISHYKSISNLHLKLKERVICVGKNASGKSNFLDAISFLGDIATEGIDNAFAKRHGFKSVFQWSKFKPYDLTISVKLASRGGVGSYRIQITSKGENYLVKSESGIWEYIERFGEDKGKKNKCTFHRDSHGKTKIRGVAYFERNQGHVSNVSAYGTDLGLG